MCTDTRVDDEQQFRAGYVAIVGVPNAGKSTLMNSLLREKLTAVSFKPQTTRFVVRGILTGEQHQIILEDTPGLLDPRRALDHAMLRLARITAEEADLLVFLFVPFANDLERQVEIAEALPGEVAIVAAINKIDLVHKPTILPLIDRLATIGRIKEIVPISAKLGHGLDILKRRIISYLPISPPLYPPDLITDQPERFFAAEIIREHLVLRYRQELPYACAVEIEEFLERHHGKDFVRAVIWVERESQKAIVVGRKGQAIKKLGERARTAMEQLLGREVYLELWVKVKPKWRDREADLNRLGFGKRQTSSQL
jgi:GTP-binding protein Era